MATFHGIDQQKWTAAQHNQVQELRKRWKAANSPSDIAVMPEARKMFHVSGEKSAEQTSNVPLESTIRNDTDSKDAVLKHLLDNDKVQRLQKYWEQFLLQFKHGSGSTGSGSSGLPGSGGSGSGKDYLEQMYSAALEAQLESLKAAYQQNLTNLDSEEAAAEDLYREQKRQSAGEAERMAANWREVANAYGLNSGAVGQAALAMNNQRQSDLNALSREQAAALAEIQRQRTLLGQQYQSAINQALAENQYERANALYKEAVRMEELWRKNGADNIGWPLEQWWPGR